MKTLFLFSVLILQLVADLSSGAKLKKSHGKKEKAQQDVKSDTKSVKKQATGGKKGCPLQDLAYEDIALEDNGDRALQSSVDFSGIKCPCWRASTIFFKTHSWFISNDVYPYADGFTDNGATTLFVTDGTSRFRVFNDSKYACDVKAVFSLQTYTKQKSDITHQEYLQCLRTFQWTTERTPFALPYYPDVAQEPRDCGCWTNLELDILSQREIIGDCGKPKSHNVNNVVDFQFEGMQLVFQMNAVRCVGVGLGVGDGLCVMSSTKNSISHGFRLDLNNSEASACRNMLYQRCHAWKNYLGKYPYSF